MKTISLPIINSSNIFDYIRIYNDLVRIAFNRMQDKVSNVEINKILKEIFPKTNSWIIASAIAEAKDLYSKNNDKKIIFGGKNNLKRYLKKLISKEEFKEKRNRNLNIQGETLHKGNRLFSFDFLNNRVLFKPYRNINIEIIFSKVRKSINYQLIELQRLSDNKEITISVKLTKNTISFTFDESKLKIYKKFQNLKESRILGLDLNPDYIGLSILEFSKDDKFKIIKKQYFDLNALNRTEVSSDKRRFENIEVCHSVIKLCNEFKVSKLVLEDLNITSKDMKRGKYINRKNNNVWIRNLIRNKLRMLCINFGIEFIEVMPYYSSQIGNIVFGNDHTPDMIASSIELARRGYKNFQKDWFYPNFEYYVEKLNEQWKQTLILNNIKNWKELFLLIKNSKLKYRVLIDETKMFCHNSLRKSSYKSNIFIYSYT